MATTKARLERGALGVPDVMYYILGEDQKERAEMSIRDIDADVRLLVIAGSDTTASTLAFALFHLIRNPIWYTRLQDELSQFRTAEVDTHLLANLPVLNAVISETQRINAIVPSKSQRIVPSGGAVIAGSFVPGGTIISVPFQALMTDKRYFSPGPKEWRPERWIEPSKEEAMEQKAFLPFSSGPFNCAGRLIALLELRYLLTIFVLNINAKFPCGFNEQAFLESILDRFTVQKGDLMGILENID